MDADHSSQRFVPFSWENRPGVSKVVARGSDEKEGAGEQGHQYLVALKLPPPPCPQSSDKHSLIKMVHRGEPAFGRRQVRSSSKRRFRIEDDPFLMAYKECTKTSQAHMKKMSSKESSTSVKTVLGYFSCRTSSCYVRDNSTVRILGPQPGSTLALRHQ
uniref:Uncharacterized protein n=1 Tax=Kalanchoe fedtschenkoi TaxID=63787 RepID=A0A7N0ZQ59_KALFE